MISTSLNNAIIQVLAEEMGPAGPHCYHRVCQTMKKHPGSIGRNDLDDFAAQAYALVRLSLGEPTARSLHDRILQLKK